MQAEARAVRLALSAFSAILPSTMGVWVDNTSQQGAANKGSSESHAMTWGLRRIYEFLDSRGIQATFAYVRSAENPADGISRGRVFTLQDLAKGWHLRRGAAASCGWKSPKSGTSRIMKARTQMNIYRRVQSDEGIMPRRWPPQCAHICAHLVWALVEDLVNSVPIPFTPSRSRLVRLGSVFLLRVFAQKKIMRLCGNRTRVLG
ncbi:putative target of rapamycin (TOR) kinase 1 [Trypanosoma cruzi]|uniref:Putative target of rapamycin (TOR) kinase 1 n=1 Tax=Trypanosoma cruzi TaxID=5693 RepID=A0A2V2X261_TRYCR|nr:putative target of rapamycin (TOR) kinase 1 [Trypanosoma cruzi]